MLDGIFVKSFFLLVDNARTETVSFKFDSTRVFTNLGPFLVGVACPTGRYWTLVEVVLFDVR